MAQTNATKMSGVARCEKSDPQYTLAIDDMPNHSVTISRTKWTRPYEIEGIGAQSCFITGFSELSGNTSRYRSDFTDTMTNGDKVYYGAKALSLKRRRSPERGREMASPPWNRQNAGHQGARNLRGEEQSGWKHELDLSGRDTSRQNRAATSRLFVWTGRGSRRGW
jgi:hypothetical protein